MEKGIEESEAVHIERKKFMESEKDQPQVPEDRKISLQKLVEAIKPNPDAKDKNKQAYRMIIIDGCNFLFKTEGNKHGRMFDHDTNATRRLNARAALLLVYAFLQMRFEVIFVVKEIFSKEKNIMNSYVLNHLKRAGIVHFLPDAEDDDKAMLESAMHNGAIVISNDNFKQDRYSSYKNVKEHRKIGFSCDFNGEYSTKDFVSYDGRFVSNLQIYLHKSLTEFKQMAICQPDDPMFKIVKQFEMSLDEYYQLKALKHCKLLADYERLKLCYSYHRGSDDVKSPKFFKFNEKEGVPEDFDEFFDTYMSYPPISFSSLKDRGK